MAGPYLIEVRTGGEMKQQLRDIMYDVANEFGVRRAVDPRPVPHITLFGPYDTDRGPEVKRRLLDVFEDFDVVPYRLDGFGAFPENNVIYADVVPSPELRSLRRAISRELRPICTDYTGYDTDYYHEFHITIAFRDVGHKFDDIWTYVTDHYDPQFDAYASRITSLRKRSMLWEYDLLCGCVLDPDAATSADSWKQTERALDRQSSPDDHADLAPSPSAVGRTVGRWKARLRREW